MDISQTQIETIAKYHIIKFPITAYCNFANYLTTMSQTELLQDRKLATALCRLRSKLDRFVDFSLFGRENEVILFLKI